MFSHDNIISIIQQCGRIILTIIIYQRYGLKDGVAQYVLKMRDGIISTLVVMLSKILIQVTKPQ